MLGNSQLAFLEHKELSRHPLSFILLQRLCLCHTHTELKHCVSAGNQSERNDKNISTNCVLSLGICDVKCMNACSINLQC